MKWGLVIEMIAHVADRAGSDVATLAGVGHWLMAGPHGAHAGAEVLDRFWSSL